MTPRSDTVEDRCRRPFGNRFSLIGGLCSEMELGIILVQEIYRIRIVSTVEVQLTRMQHGLVNLNRFSYSSSYLLRIVYSTAILISFVFRRVKHVYYHH